MKNHASACRDCAEELAVWSQVTKMGGRERGYEPPSGVVRIVKTAIIGTAPVRGTSRIREFAQLVFDSFRQAQVEGARSAMPGPRQLLYRAGAIVIDMRLEERPGSDRSSLLGQVFSSENNDEGMNEVPVHLLSGRDEVAKTQTNLFGEFHLEYDKAKDLQVSLAVSDTKDVFIPLDESIWRTPLGN
ncbi:MAG TPA: hypothetical protein VGD60_18745 [Candidatus Acidoferrales bacterium]